jgi:hypothetical protein
VAAVPLLLAAGGAGVLWHLNDAARAELRTVNQQWFGAFERALADPDRQRRYAADETLRSVANLVRQAQQAGVRFDPTGDPPISYSGYRNAQSALEIVHRVERELTPERWQRLAAVDGIRQRYEARGWSQPATYLADLARGPRPSAAADVAGGIDRLLDVTSRIGSDAVWLDEQWASTRPT